MAMAAYLKIKTIEGESTESNHTNWIEVVAFNHSIHQQDSGSVSTSGSLTAGRSDHAYFTITKQVDKATPKLMLACASGEDVQEVTLELVRAKSSTEKITYMTVKLSPSVLIASVAFSGSGGGESLPLEEVSFKYSKIDWIYTSTGTEQGQIATAYDLSKV
jgi:type VI secretion system secreted protein Hcp